ncbi:Hypothetical protein R9X50_00157900 [Acrodontium crateriforme]|uniref:Carboxylic ester hydrolase n=1 Tax=Acrodontium crateriforme TaxID=150365 RepID=A0AAQ3R5Y0_9PEZI|nr:Hypothetical protein R9X50_00157900 [Acrodontium crateriforme]
MHQDDMGKSYRLESPSLGVLDGVELPSGCRYFGGLPYGLPPLGPYRFRQPRALPESYRYGTKENPGRFQGGTAVCPQPKFPNQSLWNEDMLQLNIYISPGEKPAKGWPVFFYIHGGFLQWGDPNMDPSTLVPLMTETPFRAIVVAPAYRLNSFGYLCSRELESEAHRNGETTGNMGFWDQRLALEWTAKNIEHFGGDRHNITVGGYSAGSHSTFQQLAFELYFVPEEKAIIRRAIMWSNSPGIQPKTVDEHQEQFDELLAILDIPLHLPAETKLARLRATTPHDLIQAQDKLKISEFRAATDGDFISKNIIANINSGDFARRMKTRGIRLMNGECRDERFSYQTWRTPASSFEAVHTRLCGDYPKAIVAKLMQHYCGPSMKLPAGVEDWQELFGIIYANMQVHCLERGFHNALVKGGLKPGKDLLRYRFNWRAKCVDGVYPPEWKVTHATDLCIWWWGSGFGDGLTEDEKLILKPFNEAFSDFVAGKDVLWSTEQVKQVLRLDENGKTGIWIDDRWEEGLQVWELVNGSPSGILAWSWSKL